MAVKYNRIYNAQYFGSPMNVNAAAGSIVLLKSSGAFETVKKSVIQSFVMLVLTYH